VLSYLLSRPPTWEARLSDIVNRATDGTYAVRSALDELEEQGFIIRSQVRDENGLFAGFQFDVYDERQPESKRTHPEDRTKVREPTGKPVCGKPANGKPVNGKPNPSNTEGSNTEESNTETSKDGADAPPEPEQERMTSDEFEESLFGPPPERSEPAISATDLTTQEGRDRMRDRLLRKRRERVEGAPWLDLEATCSTIAKYNPGVEIARDDVLRFVAYMIDHHVPLDTQNRSEVRFWLRETESLLRKADHDLRVLEQALQKALRDDVSIKSPKSVAYAIADVMRHQAKGAGLGDVSGSAGGVQTRIRKETIRRPKGGNE
jgi:hypothetical protein